MKKTNNSGRAQTHKETDECAEEKAALKAYWKLAKQTARITGKPLALRLLKLADILEEKADSAFPVSPDADCVAVQLTDLTFPASNAPLAPRKPDWEEWQRRFGIGEDSPLAEAVAEWFKDGDIVKAIHKLQGECRFRHCGVNCPDKQGCKARVLSFILYAIRSLSEIKAMEDYEDFIKEHSAN